VIMKSNESKDSTINRRFNEINSIQLHNDYIIIETDKGTRVIKNNHPHYNVYRDNIISMGLTLYDYEDKVRKYVLK
jgi:hypothetical protein